GRQVAAVGAQRAEAGVRQDVDAAQLRRTHGRDGNGHDGLPSSVFSSPRSASRGSGGGGGGGGRAAAAMAARSAAVRCPGTPRIPPPGNATPPIAAAPSGYAGSS